MKLIVITTSDRTDHSGWHKLKASLEKHGYEYEHILHPFVFGHQLPIVRDWCENYKGDATHLLYTDAYDTVAFSGPDEVIRKFTECKMLISAEKNCYPHPERAKDYPETNTPWKYVNGGGWLVDIKYFIELCKKEKLNANSHDQVWLMESFFNNPLDIQIDNNCEIFQTIAFSYPEEWQLIELLSADMQRRLVNIGTNTRPVFFHGNGHTDMEWVYNAAI